MIFNGKGVCAGYAIGRISVYSRTETKVVRRKCKDTEAEIDRFDKARLATKQEYERLYQKALQEVGNNNATIFKADIVMLDDMDYIESVANIIRSQKVNAEYAVAVTIDNFTKMILQLEDDYIRERVVDVREVYNKVIEVLGREDRDSGRYDEPVILLANDLTPSEIVRLDKSNIIGFVMGDNNSNSHAAILSRSLNIPSLVGVRLYKSDNKDYMNYASDNYDGFDGNMAILDAYSGKLIVNPSDKDIELYNNKIKKEQRSKQLLNVLKGKETITLSGKKINLYANISNEKDVAAALSNDAEGAGLYRTEYIYMDRQQAPTEEEQVAIYKMIVENMGGRKVIIRTADIGADKQVPYMELGKEENPALGYRGIRISLDRRDMFETQLRAIYRASYYGNIAIMFPMITSLEEVKAAKKITEDIKAELKKEGYPFRECEIGIMIETPAAVMISDLLAEEVDFFSLGTNDLSQYTLAVDRTNEKMGEYYNPAHEAIMRMIKMTVENAHKAECRVGICGEITISEKMIATLLEYGIDEISVAPSNILAVREIIRNLK